MTEFCLIHEIVLVNNFLTNNERLKPFESHSGSWLWQHISRSRSSKVDPL